MGSLCFGRFFVCLRGLVPDENRWYCAGEYAVTSRGDVDTDWNTDYASKGYEYFDVWAPEIATHYGEVFCTPTPGAPSRTAALTATLCGPQGLTKARHHYRRTSSSGSTER